MAARNAGRLLSAAALPETHRMIGRSSRRALISGRTAILGLFTTPSTHDY
jgi:hypothetical protein